MRQNGFSLMELILVIVIMGILAGAMVPMFTANRNDAIISKVNSDLDAIKAAAMMLHTDTGRWPTVANGATVLITNPNDTVNYPNWAGPYLAEWKNDPYNPSHPYAFNLQGTTLRIGSAGPSGASVGCTGDDICVIVTPNNTL